ncbi:MAG: hypothetical protein HQK89_06645 [Nitrospirae bacterium]|nr:hypothetical protein [Nitrospirota bacterium]
MIFTVKEQIIRELDELSPETQEKILRVIHLMKEEVPKGNEVKQDLRSALSEIDELAIETGIHDLSYQHDHYIYGIPKK